MRPVIEQDGGNSSVMHALRIGLYKYLYGFTPSTLIDVCLLVGLCGNDANHRCGDYWYSIGVSRAVLESQCHPCARLSMLNAVS